MGDVAASGGYYIAAPAHYIFAQRSTITGSIGVFGVLPYTGKMFKEKLGIDFDFVQTNQYGNISINKKLSAEEMKMIQDEVQEIYIEFLDIVSKGRKLPLEKVKSIAKGRVWIGEDALKIGLVDEIGGLRDAMNYAAKTAKIDKPVYAYYPKDEKDKISELLMTFAGDEMKINNNGLSIGKEGQKFLEIFRLVSEMKGAQARLPFLIEIE